MNRPEPAVAIYVFKGLRSTKGQKYSHPAACHDELLWIGAEVLRDTLSRNGVDVGYTGPATVNRNKVILVSITAAREWWQFIRERVRWPDGKYTVIVGGAGLTNIEPFLPYFDCAVWGRAESFICEVVGQAIDGKRYRNANLCWADEYDPGATYRFSQAESVYPRTLVVGGKSKRKQKWIERAIGCRSKCAFCLYSWTHNPVIPAGESGQFNTICREGTFWTIDYADPPRVTAIDGVSERIRLTIGKPITNEMLTEGLARLSSESPYRGRIKLFNIVRYPSEKQDDYRELAECFNRADGDLPRGRKALGVELSNTPLIPEPCTPLACAEVCANQYAQGHIAALLRQYSEHPGQTKYNYFSGQRLWAIETGGTPSLASIVLEVIALRAKREDAELIRRIACSTRFWNAPRPRQWVTLRAEAQAERFCRRYYWDELPTANLLGVVPRRVLEEKAEQIFARLFA